MANTSRVVQTREQGRKLIISLSCGHVVTKAIGYWRSYYTQGDFRVHCPKCHGFKAKH